MSAAIGVAVATLAWRDVKCDDIYDELVRADMERDESPVVVYRSRTTGRVLVRPASWFEAGDDVTTIDMPPAAGVPVIPAVRAWRHIKSGCIYDELMRAEMDSDGSSAVVYRSQNAGRVWVRPASEFDVKFEGLATASGLVKG